MHSDFSDVGNQFGSLMNIPSPEMPASWQKSFRGLEYKD